MDEIKRILDERNGVIPPRPVEQGAPPAPVPPGLVEENLQLRQRVKELESLLGDAGKLGARPLSVILENARLSPAEELLRMVTAKEVDTDQKIKILTELLSYQIPKLKSVETKGQVDHKVTVTIRRYGKEKIPAQVEQSVGQSVGKHIAEQFKLPVIDPEVVNG